MKATQKRQKKFKEAGIESKSENMKGASVEAMKPRTLHERSDVFSWNR